MDEEEGSGEGPKVIADETGSEVAEDVSDNLSASTRLTSMGVKGPSNHCCIMSNRFAITQVCTICGGQGRPL